MTAKSWDPIWEKIFSSREWGKYPPEELIRFIARNYYQAKNRKEIKILDVGCGTGAGAWYIAREGFTAYGIDGSPTGIVKARERFAQDGLQGTFTVGDMTHLPYPDNFFDAAFDLFAIQHNKLDNAGVILKEIHRVLKPGGKMFGMFISVESRFNPATDPFAGKGFVHLYTSDDVKKIFEPFTIVSTDISRYTDVGNVVSHHVVQAIKQPGPA